MMSHPAQILHVHDDRIKDSLHKAEQARLIHEAKSAKGTEELRLRRLIRRLRDWNWSLVGANNAQPTWNGRLSH